MPFVAAAAKHSHSSELSGLSQPTDASPILLHLVLVSPSTYCAELMVGDAVGSSDGDAVGVSVGGGVGSSVGDAVGSSDGDGVGSSDGDAVGSSDGDAVVGVAVVDAVGFSVG